MLEMLWQLGILSAVLIFGIKIGMAMGFAGITKKQVLLISLINAISIIILSVLCEPYTDSLYQIINQYSYVLFGLMAIIIFITGIKTIKDWKSNQKDHATATCLALIVPCPCCIAAILGSIIIIAPIISISTLLLGSLSAFLLMLVIVIFYFLSEKIVQKINKPYPVVLGNFMIFVGLYFLIAMSILPNLSRALLDNYDSFSFNIPYELLGIFGVLALVIILVYYIESKTNYLN
ncbi:MAG: transporter [Methanosphaera stadtmanae]|jgi:predicted transporter|nr:transporter [Methanosphaera stadtmanae]